MLLQLLPHKQKLRQEVGLGPLQFIKTPFPTMLSPRAPPSNHHPLLSRSPCHRSPPNPPTPSPLTGCVFRLGALRVSTLLGPTCVPDVFVFRGPATSLDQLCTPQTLYFRAHNLPLRPSCSTHALLLPCCVLCRLSDSPRACQVEVPGALQEEEHSCAKQEPGG